MRYSGCFDKEYQNAVMDLSPTTIKGNRPKSIGRQEWKTVIKGLSRWKSFVISESESESESDTDVQFEKDESII